MDNLKYYNDSFAYNYDIFAPKAPKKAEILEYPEKKVKARAKANVKVNTDLIIKCVIAVLVLAAVCGSLFLRAEISTLESKINKVNNEITAIEGELTRAEVEMERKISYRNLEEAAAELGMQKCEKSQVTYVKINDSDTAENIDGQMTAEVE